MSTNVPTISVTSDTKKSSKSSDSEDNSDSNSNGIDVSVGLTDVEDFDSNAEIERSNSRRSSKNSLFIRRSSANAQADVTDVEDYNDSEVDEEELCKSNLNLELKLSVEEFLQHDAQEHFSTTDGIKEVVQHKSGNFLKAQNLDGISDYLTDCEEYDTDSEIDTKCEKSAIVDLYEMMIEHGKVNIADTIVTKRNCASYDCEYEDASVISDISDLASAVSDILLKDDHGLSEDEVLELSGNEEICQISYSDSESLKNSENLSDEDVLSNASLPPIDVTFMPLSNRVNMGTDRIGCSSKRHNCKGAFLKVEENKREEVLTDIERFDDSVAEDNDDSFDEDDDNQRPIPQAVILAIGDDGACHTDCEDFLIDDIFETTGLDIGIDVDVDNNTIIPLPHREVVVLQENKFGDTVTNVMPMDKEYQFGIYVTLKEDECLTDIEDFSCADNDDIQEWTVNLPSRSISPNNIVMVESDVTVANEVFKSQQSKRLEVISNAESVTDVEEIFMAGTNSRKKKVKTRSVAKNKSKYLEAPRTRENLSGGGTDIEDMDLSESGLLTTSKPEENLQSVQSLTDKVTDIEEMTTDDASSVSEIEPPQIELNFSNLKDYDGSSKNRVVSSEVCGTVSRNKRYRHTHMIDSHFTLESELTNQPQHTDIEDVQLPSDAEDYPYINEPTPNAVCQELSEMLNECCTTVHEKCTNSFNIDAEKLYIKGMVRESHTDIEYVESDESAARGSK